MASVAKIETACLVSELATKVLASIKRAKVNFSKERLNFVSADVSDATKLASLEYPIIDELAKRPPILFLAFKIMSPSLVRR